MEFQDLIARFGGGTKKQPHSSIAYPTVSTAVPNDSVNYSTVRSPQILRPPLPACSPSPLARYASSNAKLTPFTQPPIPQQPSMQFTPTNITPSTQMYPSPTKTVNTLHPDDYKTDRIHHRKSVTSTTSRNRHHKPSDSIYTSKFQLASIPRLVPPGVSAPQGISAYSREASQAQPMVYPVGGPAYILYDIYDIDDLVPVEEEQAWYPVTMFYRSSE